MAVREYMPGILNVWWRRERQGEMASVLQYAFVCFVPLSLLFIAQNSDQNFPVVFLNSARHVGLLEFIFYTIVVSIIPFLFLLLQCYLLVHAQSGRLHQQFNELQLLNGSVDRWCRILIRLEDIMSNVNVKIKMNKWLRMELLDEKQVGVLENGGDGDMIDGTFDDTRRGVPHWIFSPFPDASPPLAAKSRSLVQEMFVLLIDGIDSDA